MICAEAGCAAPAETRGRCGSHYRRLLRMGRCGYRDAAPARAHVTALRGLGWTWEQIADAAGLSTYVAHQVGRGRTRRLLPESERALLAVLLVPRDSHRGIDSAGTRRRVQALAWMGWPCAEVARRAGATARTLTTLISPSRHISYTLARRVADVYDELSMRPGPSNITAGKARGRGYLPPLAWDDDLLDLPEADLAVELKRRAAAMGDDEVRRCDQARGAGDPSLLIAAGAREYRARNYARRRALDAGVVGS